MSAKQLSQISCGSLSGVGPKALERLRKCGIDSIADLLFHLPLHYQDRTRITPIANAQLGRKILIEGQITRSDVTFGKRRSLLCTIADPSGQMSLRFMHFFAGQKNQLAVGRRVRCFGEVRGFFPDQVMFHPEYEVIKEGFNKPVAETLTPVYPTTDGMQQKTWSNLIGQAINQLNQQGGLNELLPDEITLPQDYPSLQQALLICHRPTPDIALQELESGEHIAIQRLAFEELLAQQLGLRRLRQRVQQTPATALKQYQKLRTEFIAQLPFQFTTAQSKVIATITQDLQQPYPMLRLVQGDVGSGKTVVAACALLQAIENQQQVAFMAPTEILAKQHYLNIKKWFEPLGVKVFLLSRELKTAARREVLAEFISPQPLVAVGTHALFQKQVVFHKLSLVVIDEQHRFGVEQRLSLAKKGESIGLVPHQLIMTATPIPRTLAMTAYADLDVSVIDELPPGRTPVKTVALSNTRRAEVVERIQRVCASGRQAYWVCPLIDDSEVLQCEAAERASEQLRQALPDCRVGLVHGRLKIEDKAIVMEAFKQGELDILVATTVIEVGVDVPNASLMVIENAERLGLSQLHQLRGRVGRGAVESFCVLLYQAPLSNTAKSRLAIMRESNDGFVIAKRDMALRGPGEILGTRQTGLVQYKVADFYRDKALIPQVREVADVIVQQYPERVAPLIQRWLGNAEEYGKA